MKSQEIVQQEMKKIHYYTIIQEWVNQSDIGYGNISNLKIGNVVLAIVDYSAYIVGTIIDAPRIDGHKSYLLKILNSHGPVSVHQNDDYSTIYVNDFEIYQIIEE